jgi:hypothetical protein
MVKTTMIWTIGRMSHFRFGDSYIQTVKAGAFEWKLTFYPKGLTDPEYARYALHESVTYCDQDHLRILFGLILPFTASTLQTWTVSVRKEMPSCKRQYPSSSLGPQMNQQLIWHLRAQVSSQINLLSLLLLKAAR